MIKHTLTIALATLCVLVLITGIGNWTNALDTEFIAYGQTGGSGGGDGLHDDDSDHQRQFGRRDADDEG